MIQIRLWQRWRDRIFKTIKQQSWEDRYGMFLCLVFASAVIYGVLFVDFKRKADLRHFKNALVRYGEINAGSFRVPAGYGATGMGWINQRYDEKPSIVEVLQSAGLLASFNLDDPEVRPGYILFLCDANKSFAIFATLDWPSSLDRENARDECGGSGQYGAVDAYGKNYATGVSSRSTVK